MNNRQRTLALLNYKPYDRLPIVHFGYWVETLELWAEQGHVTRAEAATWQDGNHVDLALNARLGFDFNWGANYSPHNALFPAIEPEVLEVYADGTRKELNKDGAIILMRPGAQGIPQELDHTLKDRRTWDEIFKPKLQFTLDRIITSTVDTAAGPVRFDEGGQEMLQDEGRDYLLGLSLGSLYGRVRNWLGLAGSAYLQIDDPVLFDEIVETSGELAYRCAEAVLATGARLDFGHFWEDICFNRGPLLRPDVFRDKVGPHYARITKLLNAHGINLVSVDCDGLIDLLIPIWLDNGVNVMFPIEVGTIGGSIAPWRKKYGRELRGVGGVDKRAFAQDYAALDAEIERMKPLVDLGGYIPCIDHRLPPDAEWKNVQYYCEAMRKAFG